MGVSLTFLSDANRIVSLPPQVLLEPEIPTDSLRGRLVEVLASIEIEDLNSIQKIQDIITDVFQSSSSKLLERPIKISPKHKVIVFRQDESIELYLYQTNKEIKHHCLDSKSQTIKQKGKSKELRGAFKIALDLKNPCHKLDAPEKVALLKSNFSDFKSTSEKEEIFKHEVEILKTLKGSSNFSNLYASTIYDGTKQGKFCRKGIMLQKFYPKGDYEDLLSEKVNFQFFSKRVTYTKELLKALKELENRKICHSDLTPANIMQGDKENAVIIDFEFALSLYELLNLENQSELIGRYLCRGTPELMPPEKITAALKGFPLSNPDLKGNVWSIGCILHYLHEGSWPEVVTKIGKYVLEKQRQTFFNKETKSKIVPKVNVLENLEKEIFRLFEVMQESANTAKKGGMDYLLKMMLHPDPLKRFSATDANLYFDGI